MLAFRQNSNFIWRDNHMSKIEASKMRFCEWGSEYYDYSEPCSFRQGIRQMLAYARISA